MRMVQICAVLFWPVPEAFDPVDDSMVICLQ